MTIWVSLINIFVILNYCKIYDFVIQKVKTQLSKQPYKGIIIVGLVLGFNIFHLSFMCIIMVQFALIFSDGREIFLKYKLQIKQLSVYKLQF
jgi:hypothetical protein